MKSNRLQLNSLKTEFLWCAASRRQNFLDHSPFVIGVDYIQPADVVRNLGLLLESDLSMTNHISRVVSTYSGILRQLRSVGRSLRVMPSVNLSTHSYCLEWTTVTLRSPIYRRGLLIVFRPSSMLPLISSVVLASSITSRLFSMMIYIC